VGRMNPTPAPTSTAMPDDAVLEIASLPTRELRTLPLTDKQVGDLLARAWDRTLPFPCELLVPRDVATGGGSAAEKAGGEAS
jgi:hypothetical protein